MSSQPRPLKLALVGCGQIADAHLDQMRRIAGVQVVAVCDVLEDLARQAAERFDVPQRFSDVQAMLQAVRPDVLHITTPVQTHAPLAIQALRSGVHVYVEKPFTLDAAEAQHVLDEACAADRLVCLGHDQLYDPIWLRCRELCQGGQIGEVRHVESVLGYPIDGPFGRQVASDPNHWVRRLPGGLFHNTLSHPLYRITEFLTDEQPEVWATWFSHDERYPFPTELRVHLRGRRVTGSLLFTSAVRPRFRRTRVYGTAGTLDVDLEGQVLRHERDARLPGVFAKLETPWRQWREAFRNLKTNIRRFCRSDLHYFAGMRRLFELFYAAIREGGEPPIPYAEIIRFTRLLDTIFASCRRWDAVKDWPEDGDVPPLCVSEGDSHFDGIDKSVRELLPVEASASSGRSRG
ncbi:MAG: Gfo/Idh/MocA family oxidoreductase [Planctomycetes bacterium]|nr:Gfo/Idh/MocA family oxidoreductase [Planctomycetota bacterium]